jgi:hypothetical protein
MYLRNWIYAYLLGLSASSYQLKSAATVFDQGSWLGLGTFHINVILETNKTKSAHAKVQIHFRLHYLQVERRDHPKVVLCRLELLLHFGCQLMVASIKTNEMGDMANQKRSTNILSAALLSFGFEREP